MRRTKSKGLWINLLVAGVPLLLGAALALVRNTAPAEQQSNPVPEVLPTVKAMMLQRAERPITEVFYGIIRPVQRVDLASETGGTVAARGTRDDGGRLEPGDAVRPGQTLLQMDSSHLRIQLAQAEAALARAQAARELAELALTGVPSAIAGAQAMFEETQVLRRQAERVFKDVEKLHEASEAASKNELEGKRTKLDQATARLKLFQSKLDQAKLGEKTAQAELKMADAAVAEAQAAVDAARAELSKATIKSPAAGNVAKFHVKVGETVSPGRPLVTIVRLDAVKLVLRVVESKVRSFRPGQRVDLRVRSLAPAGSVAEAAGQSFRGTVERVAIAADDRTGLFDVDVRVENRRLGRETPARPRVDWLLKPGMIAQTRVIVDTPVAYLVPIRAVEEGRSGRYIWVLSKPSDRAGNEVMVAHRRRIVVNRIVNAGYLLERVPAGARMIVLEGHNQLEDGRRVRVVNLSELSATLAGGG